MTEDRYLQAVEAKPGPGARAVVHHLLTYLIQDIDQDEVLAGRLDDRPTNNESFLNEFAVGKNGDILPEGTAKLVKAGSKIRFNLHYHPSGKETVDRARVGLEVLSEGLQAEVPPDLAADRQRARRARHPAPTPSRATTATTASRSRRASPRCRRTCTIAASGCASRRSCRSGRAETLNCMYFDFNWHKVYNYADEATPLLPAGTVLHTILWHDNTANNRSNPDPRNWIGYGQRTMDEMAFSWVTWTYLDEEDYKTMVAERAASRATASRAVTAMRRSRAIGCGVGRRCALGVAAPARSSRRAGTRRRQDGVYTNSVRYARGQSIQPVFEGWEKNPDGTFSMWFGYLNRNYEERLNIPVGRQQRLQRRRHGPGRGVRAAALAVRVQGRWCPRTSRRIAIWSGRSRRTASRRRRSARCGRCGKSIRTPSRRIAAAARRSISTSRRTPRRASSIRRRSRRSKPASR